jgi:rhamnosyltransferase
VNSTGERISSQSLPALTNVVAVVVTFNPDPTFAERLRAIRAQVNRVIVVDNASSNWDQVELAASSVGCVTIRNKDNVGIAGALNQALGYASENGLEWIWAFDQDTKPLAGAWDAIRCAAEAWLPVRRTAVFAMSMRDRRTHADYLVPAIASYSETVEVPSAITSGSLFCVGTARQIGGFADCLFIDGVDHEYCLRSRKYGFAVIKALRSKAEHSLGSLIQHRLLGLKLHSTNHCPLRRYYMTRNTLFIVAKYFLVDPKTCVRLMGVSASTFVTIVLFESAKRAKLRGMRLGVRDFFSGKLGPADRVVSDSLATT